MFFSPGGSATINNERKKQLFGTENTGLPTSYNIDTDEEFRIIREKDDFVRTRQIPEQADQQN